MGGLLLVHAPGPGNLKAQKSFVHRVNAIIDQNHKELRALTRTHLE